MANAQKHRKNLIQEWLVADEEVLPARARGYDVQEPGVKIRKPVLRGRFRQASPVQPSARPEPALVREPAPPVRLADKQSQPSSRDHLLKLERLPQLRAPSYRSRKPAPTGIRRPTSAAARASARRAGGGRRAR